MADKAIPTAPVWVRLAASVIRRLPAGRYRLAGWVGRRTSGRFWMRFPSAMREYQFCCDLRDQIAREVCFTGRYEPQETALVWALLRPGMTFVDVGANWGYFTLLAAHLVGKRGQVLSLEPDPRLFGLLQTNVASNALCQVTPLALAASDRAGNVILAGFDEQGGNFGLSRVVHATQAPNSFEVPAQTLDEVLRARDVATVDLLKMDIEGAEGLALAGLSGSLSRRSVKRVLLELHPAQLAEHGQSATKVIAWLRGFGYQAWSVDHSAGMNRRAAYASRLDARSLLRPLASATELDCWPHLLWTMPGLDPLG